MSLKFHTSHIISHHIPHSPPCVSYTHECHLMTLSRPLYHPSLRLLVTIVTVSYSHNHACMVCLVVVCDPSPSLPLILSPWYREIPPLSLAAVRSSPPLSLPTPTRVVAADPHSTSPHAVSSLFCFACGCAAFLDMRASHVVVCLAVFEPVYSSSVDNERVDRRVTAHRHSRLSRELRVCCVYAICRVCDPSHILHSIHGRVYLRST